MQKSEKHLYTATWNAPDAQSNALEALKEIERLMSDKDAVAKYSSDQQAVKKAKIELAILKQIYELF